MFLELLAQSADENCRLNRDETILVGVSGGADSLAMQVGLHALGYALVVGHLDHGLRAESARDAAFVRDIAARLGVPFVTERVDVGAVAEANKQSIEEAAREVRYHFLFDQARRCGARVVAVGHHADDQVETILMHFLRGAALSGLAGMPYRRLMPQWDAKIPLVRPLLEISREIIDDYLRAEGLTPRVDLSNEDTAYFRNRLRHALIPELETYNPQFKQVIWRMSQVLGEEDAFLDTLAQEAWQRCFRLKSNVHVELVREALLKLPVALQRRVLRQAISLLRPDLRDVGFDAVTRGLEFAAEPSESGEMDLVAQLHLAVVRDMLILKDWGAPLPDLGQPLLVADSHALTLTPGLPVQLANGWSITAEVMPEVPMDLAERFRTIGTDEAWLDADKVNLPLLVRPRKPGERWQPLWMTQGRQTLQDFFINQKVPSHLRDRWPLVCSGEAVAWVGGMRPSEAFKITGNTQRILRLQLKQVGKRNETSLIAFG